MEHTWPSEITLALDAIPLASRMDVTLTPWLRAISHSVSPGLTLYDATPAPLAAPARVTSAAPRRTGTALLVDRRPSGMPTESAHTAESSPKLRRRTRVSGHLHTSVRRRASKYGYLILHKVLKRRAVYTE